MYKYQTYCISYNIKTEPIAVRADAMYVICLVSGPDIIVKMPNIQYIYRAAFDPAVKVPGFLGGDSNLDQQKPLIRK